jgi:glycine/D-amino acid oxidase-like deaminating enzyme
MVAVPKIVIAGGGVIGTSLSYFLAKEHNTSVQIIDPKGIAPAASSKAGGFLARNWRDGTDLEELQRLGFDLHQSLADDLMDTNIDYRRLTCSAVAIDESQTRKVQKPPSKKLEGVEWVDRGVLGSVSMGDEENIAQGMYSYRILVKAWSKFDTTFASN